MKESIQKLLNTLNPHKTKIMSLILLIVFITVSVWLIQYIIQETMKASIVAYTETMKLSENHECGMKKVSLEDLRASIRIMNEKTEGEGKNIEKLITGIALRTGGTDGRFVYTLNQNITVTYAFEDLSSSISDSEFNNFESIVLSKINPFVNIRFVRISLYNDADLKIQFKAREGNNSGAWAYLGVGFYGKNPGMEFDSRIFTDSGFSFFKVTCIIHEFGHILSLGHEFLHKNRGNLFNRDVMHQDFGCYSGSCSALQCNGNLNVNIYDVMSSCRTNSPICPEVCSSLPALQHCNANIYDVINSCDDHSPICPEVCSSIMPCIGVARDYTLKYGPSRYSLHKDANTFVTTPYDAESIMGYQSIPARYYCDSSKVYAGREEFSTGDKELLALLYPINGSHTTIVASNPSSPSNTGQSNMLNNVIVVIVFVLLFLIVLIWIFIHKLK